MNLQTNIRYFQKFLSDTSGRVTGIVTIGVQWDKDETGAWKMSELAGTEKIYECDLVLLAMGFVGPEQAVIDQLAVEQDPRLNIKTNNGKYSTSLAKVFAAGGIIPAILCHHLSDASFRLSSRSVVDCLGNSRGSTSGTRNRLFADGQDEFGRTGRYGFGTDRHSIILYLLTAPRDIRPYQPQVYSFVHIR